MSVHCTSFWPEFDQIKRTHIIAEKKMMSVDTTILSARDIGLGKTVLTFETKTPVVLGEYACECIGSTYKNLFRGYTCIIGCEYNVTKW